MKTTNYIVNKKDFEKFHQDNPLFIKPQTFLYEENGEMIIIDIESLSKNELEQFIFERKELWNKVN